MSGQPGATDDIRRIATVALRRVAGFMATHPDEVIILFLEDRVTPADTAAAFERSGLLRYASTLGRFEEPPTLRSSTPIRSCWPAPAVPGGPQAPADHRGRRLLRQGDVLGVANTLNGIPPRAPATVARVAP